MHITVIGGGPGGYVAALKASKMGAEVTLVEKGSLGGTCLNAGCIPTKSYLHATDLLHACTETEPFGVHTGGAPAADFAEVVRRRDRVVRQLVGGVGFLMRKNKVTVERGFGRILAPGKVEVTAADGRRKLICCDRIILATGSVPMTPAPLGYDGQRIITSDELLSLTARPASLVIVGGGVIGCEFGQFFRRTGTDVSVVELLAHILPNEDPDVVKPLHKQMAAEGIRFYTGMGADKVERLQDCVRVTLTDGTVLECEYLLLALGRRPNLDGAWADAVPIAVENGRVVTDEYMRTGAEGIYAVGDIVDAPMLAHVASREGCVAVEHIMGGSTPIRYHAVPRCVYTNPQVACVGTTETELAAAGIPYKSGRFSFAGLGKSIVTGKTAGFVKVLADREDRLIGAAVVGELATELLCELTLAVELGLTAQQLGRVIHPHPSLSEALMEALHDVHGQSVHAV